MTKKVFNREIFKLHFLVKKNQFTWMRDRKEGPPARSGFYWRFRRAKNKRSNWDYNYFALGNTISIKRNNARFGRLDRHTGFRVYWGTVPIAKEERKHRAYVQLSEGQFEYRLFNKCRYVGWYSRRTIPDVTTTDTRTPANELPEPRYKIRLAV